MKRVLVFGMTENPGGIESCLMNYYRNIDREKVQFDFLCNSYNPVAYEDELLEKGARTFHTISRRKNPLRFKRELNKLFKEHASEWDAIWVNVCSLANVDYLKVAKEYGIKKRIIHSHNSENMDSRLRGLLHNINRHNITKYATDYWACSETAASWFYEDSLLKSVKIINNAIDVDKMSFDERKRHDIRKTIKASDDTYVIGNIGRLHFQKNQSFLIDIFYDYQKINKNSLLVLVGKGDDLDILTKKCHELGIGEKVIFTGVQSDIQGWLSAFDLFVFPSLFEGLSVVALEAQANGVPVMASDKVIPRELRINNNFDFLDLDSGTKTWAKRVEHIKGKYSREESNNIGTSFNNKGFSIANEACKLQQFFEDDRIE